MNPRKVGGALAGALGVVLLARGLQQLGAPPGDRHQARRVLMDTVVTVLVVDPDAARAREGIDAAFRRIEELVATLDHYAPGSALARLGQGRHSRGDLPAELRRALDEAADLMEATGGWYDPTLGALVDLWGFGPSGAIARPPPPASIRSALATTAPAAALRADPVALAAGTRLDLSGYAKGLAVDLAVEELRARGLAALVDAGGDLACTGPKPDGSAWTIGVRDPDGSDRLLRRFALRAGAVATSGDYERGFDHGGVRYHHLLSPRDGAPGRAHRQATARAPTCRAADAWATALFLAPTPWGLEAAPGAGVEALLVGPDGAAHATPGFPPPVEP